MKRNEMTSPGASRFCFITSEGQDMDDEGIAMIPLAAYESMTTRLKKIIGWTIAGWIISGAVMSGVIIWLNL